MWHVHDGRIDADDTTLATFETWDGEAALDAVRESPEHRWIEFEAPNDEFLDNIYDKVNVGTGYGVTPLDIYVRGSFIPDGVFVTELIEGLQSLVDKGKVVISRKGDALTTLYTRTGSMTYE